MAELRSALLETLHGLEKKGDRTKEKTTSQDNKEFSSQTARAQVILLFLRAHERLIRRWAYS